MAFVTALEVAIEAKCFSGPSGLALSNLSQSAEPGEFLAVVGPLGAGKTTLLNAFVAELRPVMAAFDWKLVAPVYDAALESVRCA